MIPRPQPGQKWHEPRTFALLRDLVDAVNALQAATGDGLISVSRRGGTPTISLNWQQLLARIPHAAGVGEGFMARVFAQDVNAKTVDVRRVDGNMGGSYGGILAVPPSSPETKWWEIQGSEIYDVWAPTSANLNGYRIMVLPTRMTYTPWVADWHTGIEWAIGL